MKPNTMNPDLGSYCWQFMLQKYRSRQRPDNKVTTGGKRVKQNYWFLKLKIGNVYLDLIRTEHSFIVLNSYLLQTSAGAVRAKEVSKA